MTLDEFKAWFEGFTEAIPGPPNKKQWDRIKERVGEIAGWRVRYPTGHWRDRPWGAYTLPSITTTTYGGARDSTALVGLTGLVGAEYRAGV